MEGMVFFLMSMRRFSQSSIVFVVMSGICLPVPVLLLFMGSFIQLFRSRLYTERKDSLSTRAISVLLLSARFVVAMKW